MTKVIINGNRTGCVSTKKGNSSGTVTIVGYWDASGGRLPDNALRGQTWIIGDGINEDTGGGSIAYLGGSIYLAPRSRITAIINKPGQNWFNWSNS